MLQLVNCFDLPTGKSAINARIYNEEISRHCFTINLVSSVPGTKKKHHHLKSMAAHDNLSLLESLPQDLLGEILSRVASSSRQELSQCLTVSKTVSAASQDYRVLRSLRLRHQSMLPLITYERYNNLMEKCLQHGNPVAHYIEGVKLLFVQGSTLMGMFHLRKSAEGKYDNGTYLYGILMLLMGKRREGRRFLRSLNWTASKLRGDACWTALKISLKYVNIPVVGTYITNLLSSEPPESCHPNDKDTRCRKCYHYKQMRKFMAFIL